MTSRIFWLPLLVVVTAGCVADGPGGDPAPSIGLVCNPCELPVETGPARAFEPAAAVSPADADHWLIASNQWHPSGVGATIMRTHVSKDHGDTWVSTRFPGDVPPTHPLAPYSVFFDPNVMIFEDGTALLTAMAAVGDIGPTGLPVVGDADANGFPFIDGFDIIAARSMDGGLTWGDATVVAIGTGHPAAPVTAYHDQPFFDRGPDGTLLLAWSFILAQGEDSVKMHNLQAATSTDNGATWTDPVTVAEGAWHRPRPAIGPDGTMWISMMEMSQDPPYPVYLASSMDGQTWTFESTPVNSWEGAWIAVDNAVHLIADPDMGRTVKVHHFNATWSERALIEGNASGHITPSLVATPDGSLVATYYVPTPSGNEYWASIIDSTGDLRQQRLDSSPIGINEVDGVIGWPIFGDYQGLAAGPGGVLVAWISGDMEDTDLRAAWLDVP